MFALDISELGDNADIKTLYEELDEAYYLGASLERIRLPPVEEEMGATNEVIRVVVQDAAALATLGTLTFTIAKRLVQRLRGRSNTRIALTWDDASFWTIDSQIIGSLDDASLDKYVGQLQAVLEGISDKPSADSAAGEEVAMPCSSEIEG